jgi:hypothetical protein
MRMAAQTSPTVNRNISTFPAPCESLPSSARAQNRRSALKAAVAATTRIAQSGAPMAQTILKALRLAPPRDMLVVSHVNHLAAVQGRAVATCVERPLFGTTDRTIGGRSGRCEAQPMRSASETMIPSGPRT